MDTTNTPRPRLSDLIVSLGGRGALRKELNQVPSLHQVASSSVITQWELRNSIPFKWTASIEAVVAKHEKRIPGLRALLGFIGDPPRGRAHRIDTELKTLQSAISAFRFLSFKGADGFRRKYNSYNVQPLLTLNRVYSWYHMGYVESPYRLGVKTILKLTDADLGEEPKTPPNVEDII